MASKAGKTYSVFLSSEYERAQWVEALKVLQEKLFHVFNFFSTFSLNIFQFFFNVFSMFFNFFS